jgi:hypothetical protein
MINQELIDKVLQIKLDTENLTVLDLPSMRYKHHKVTIITHGQSMSLVSFHNSTVNKCLWVDNDELYT